MENLFKVSTLLNEGDASYINQNYEASIQSYTQAILVAITLSSSSSCKLEVSEGDGDGDNDKKIDNNATATLSAIFRFRAFSHRAAAKLKLANLRRNNNTTQTNNDIYHDNTNIDEEAYTDAKAAITLIENKTIHQTKNNNNNNNHNPNDIATTASFPTSLQWGEEEKCRARLGQAAFHLERYDEARIEFETAARLADRDFQNVESAAKRVEEYSAWADKCRNLDSEGGENGTATSTTAGVDQGITEDRTVEDNVGGNNETPSSSASDTIDSARPLMQSKNPSTPAPPPPPFQQKQKRLTCPKYQYYQNDTTMTIAILEPNVVPSNLQVKFSLDKLTVIVTKGGGNSDNGSTTSNHPPTDFTVICGTLFDAVNVSKCKIKYMEEKVLIKLRKLESGQWHELFGSGARDQDTVGSSSDGNVKSKDADVDTGSTVDAMDTTDYKNDDNSNVQSLPRKDISANNASTRQATAAATTEMGKQRKNNAPSPYASNKDWNAIERDLKQQEENEKPEGEEALNKLFQSIYGNANDDTRRAMIKSFQTSGGTVLSTNWDEVGKTDYEKERQAPKGMEWKNWEGDRLPQKEG